MTYLNNGEDLTCDDLDLGKLTGFIDWLHERPSLEGTSFLDYGCGARPETLKVARRLGMNAIGIEFDGEVRARASDYSQCAVFPPEHLSTHHGQIDLVFLGDVVEHVSDPSEVLRNVGELLSEDGLVFIQGPLEGAPTLLHSLVSVFAWVKPGVDGSIPPYHVSLATRRSMVELVQRCGYQIRQMEITEVQWPAPTFRKAVSTRSVRSLILAATKWLDVRLSKLKCDRGNRFTMIVSKNESRM